jgi:hypothetical protein
MARGVRAALWVVILLEGCHLPWLEDKSADSAGAHGMVTAAAGGTIRTPAGVVLEVPAGAVARDVEVTITPVPVATLDPSWGAAIRLEPSGLVFAKAATLTIPLAAPIEGPGRPQRLTFVGASTADHYEDGLVDWISADRRTVSLSIWHFSGPICAANCHAGTREFLRDSFLARGLSDDEVLSCVQRRFPGATLPRCGMVKAPEIQLVLDTFFDQIDLGEYTAGVDIPPGVVERLTQAAAGGRNVVFAFSRDTLGQRTGDRRLYDDIDHTAVVERHGGAWTLRNTAVVGPAITAALGGSNLAWWPLDDINGFRKLQAGVAVEVQACRKAGCLAQDYQGTDSPAAARLYSSLPTRPVPWSAVRIYVEKTDALAACRTDAGVAAPPDAGADAPAARPDAPVTTADAPIDRAAAEVLPDRAPDALTCPIYTRTAGFCAGENGCPAGGATCPCGGGQFCCTPGFCWTRYIAGCTQEQCPPGASRNYTNHCTCPAGTRTVYDPCRAGYVVSCDPM